MVIRIILLVILPSVIFSTSLVRIFTAGSANTTRNPITDINGIIYFVRLLFMNSCPRRNPVFINPTSTPVRNRHSPRNVAIKPIIIFLICFLLNASFLIMLNTMNSPIIGLRDIDTDFIHYKNFSVYCSSKGRLLL